ncbi:unnamed protein product [Linum tenue]|uniref:Gfo/Idh/MocA-like oxidoreductase N-terminal domain-containing protein n=1 Tax=Linum tenue TaxID=586396 RepID=A0AAV0LFV6_9ROSI|nr:unnamed protein product [Linum tenue]
MSLVEPITIRFGIVGCAEIARKVSRAINLAPNAQIAAVASRSPEKAGAFAKANNVPAEAKIYGSYEPLLDDPDIDVVYLPLPTSLHLKWATLAAQKKKHVLLEKPVAVTVAELDQILAACEANGVQFMDGTMWVHHPRTAKMREFLDDKRRFGELRTIQSCFTFAAPESFLKDDIRVKPDLDSLGALGDAGWYGVRAILWAADYHLPKTVVATPGSVTSDRGVILACGASLHWEDGKSATFHCSFLTHLTMFLTAIGTQGTLQLNDFIIPFQEHEASFSTSSRAGFDDQVTRWEPGPRQEVAGIDGVPQEVRLIEEMARLVGEIKVGGAGKVDREWGARSRKTQQVLNAVKESIEKGFVPVEIA